MTLDNHETHHKVQKERNQNKIRKLCLPFTEKQDG